MKIENYSAGTWKQQFKYKSFSPSLVNHHWTWEDVRINVLLERANRAVGELNAFSLIVPDVDRFIITHVAKEAQKSSRIEGTRTEMDEALMPEELVVPEKRDDWREVQNYIQAMNEAIIELSHLPVSSRLLCGTHAILMQGARGETKNPGEVRRGQNWIGGSGPMDAAFVPPHHDDVPALMADLESFLHNENIAVPDLIRVAIAHYQFETIHPFNDGNGRIGRLLITLYLVSKGVLHKPALYLSDYFERNRASYIDGLMRVRFANDLNHWVRFFLAGVLETAHKGRKTFQNLLVLRETLDRHAMGMGKRAPNARAALDLMYAQPVFSTKTICDGINVTQPTADAIIQAFVNANIIREITGQARHRVYAFHLYINLFTT